MVDITKEKLDKVLLSLVGTSDLIEVWWNSPNKAFNMSNPWEVYNSADRLSVINYIQFYCNVQSS
jgi:hypothetical protein